MDDERIKYYPFRDDAKEILEEYEHFADELVDKFYRGYFWYEKINEDKELQSWVQELSVHAQGKGNVS